jgi:hypothetical protein
MHARMGAGSVCLRSNKGIPPTVRKQDIRDDFQLTVLNVPKISGQILFRPGGEGAGSDPFAVYL